jgi:hypothetical protein
MTACLVEDESNSGLGKYETYQCSEGDKHNSLIFNVAEGDDYNESTRAAAITTTCDNDVEAEIEIAYTAGGGSYFFEVRTKYACPTVVPDDVPEPVFDVASCKYTAADKYFVDLSPLMGVSLSYTDPLFKNTF